MSIPQFYQDVNGDCRIGRTGLPRMFPRISREGWIAYKHHDTGMIVVEGPSGAGFVYPIISVGNWPVAFGPDESIYVRVLSTGGRVEYRRLYPDGRDELLDLQGRDDAEGFNRITDDGQIILNNDPSCWRTVAGIPLSRCSDDGQGTIVGLADGMGPHGCVVIVTDGIARAWEAPDDVPHPPHVSNGLVAVSGPEPPAITDGSDWPLWKPYVAPKPDLIPLPDLGPLAPCWTGPAVETNKEARAPVMGNSSWSDAPQLPRSWPVGKWWGHPDEKDFGAARPALMGIVSTEDSDLQKGD